jgi:uncharacterized Zn-finger protein
LDRHFLTHLGEEGKSFVCEVCSKRFSAKSNLLQHEIIHQSEQSKQKIVCNLENCSKSFYYFSSLKTHIKTKHPQDFLSLYCLDTSQKENEIGNEKTMEKAKVTLV